jgi:hypothetical protein
MTSFSPLNRSGLNLSSANAKRSDLPCQQTFTAYAPNDWRAPHRHQLGAVSSRDHLKPGYGLLENPFNPMDRSFE